ncbi:hypothetical protein [Succinatimonas hippei]|uniref:hypothetical protein n=1 Tax=Succinatimonas hippei TaxID=626938 RepID=UPI0026EA97EA|nr:hypothetical protein [Succinatimonas hippei]
MRRYCVAIFTIATIEIFLTIAESETGVLRVSLDQFIGEGKNPKLKLPSLIP